MTDAATNTGKELELEVAEAYRRLGARKVEHNVEMVGNRIDDMPLRTYAAPETAPATDQVAKTSLSLIPPVQPYLAPQTHPESISHRPRSARLLTSPGYSERLTISMHRYHDRLSVTLQSCQSSIPDQVTNWSDLT